MLGWTAVTIITLTPVNIVSTLTCFHGLVVFGLSVTWFGISYRKLLNQGFLLVLKDEVITSKVLRSRLWLGCIDRYGICVTATHPFPLSGVRITRSLVLCMFCRLWGGGVLFLLAIVLTVCSHSIYGFRLACSLLTSNTPVSSALVLFVLGVLILSRNAKIMAMNDDDGYKVVTIPYMTLRNLVKHTVLLFESDWIWWHAKLFGIISCQ